MAESFDALGDAVLENLEIIFVETGNGNTFLIFGGGVKHDETNRHFNGIGGRWILLLLWCRRGALNFNGTWRGEKKHSDEATGDGERNLHGVDLQQNWKVTP